MGIEGDAVKGLGLVILGAAMVWSGRLSQTSAGSSAGDVILILVGDVVFVGGCIWMMVG